MAGQSHSPHTERRHNLKLRDLFEEAYERIVPCLDPRQAWGRGPLQHLAFRLLREAYPDLPPQEVHLLVCASVRVYRQRLQGQAEHLPQPEEIGRPQAAL